MGLSKYLTYSFLLVSLLIANLAHADSKISIDDPSCTRTEGLDPYEVPTRIGENSERFAGQCVDTMRFRPAIILSSDDKVVSFANYLHDGKYWLAELSKKAVIDTVYFQVVRFDVVSGITAAHTQFRVVFAPGSELKLTSLDKSESMIINDLVVSYEASRPQEVPYNFAVGMDTNYLSVARVLSSQQRLDESVENTTEQYIINIPQEERMSLVLGAIEQSNSEKFSRFYNTLKPNCTTEVFDLMDKLPSVAATQAQPFLPVISNDPVAGPSIQALKDRKILVSRYANLRDDVERGLTEPPADEVKKTQFELLPTVEGYPYSVVLVVPKNLESDKVLSEAKTMAYNLAPQLAQRLGSSLMLSGSDGSFSLLDSLNKLTPILKEQLNELNDQLTDEPVTLSLFVTPWSGQGKKVDVMKELGVSARLPFDTYETTYDNVSGVAAGISKASEVRMKKPESFGFLGLAIQFYLVKNDSQITLQAMGQLGPLSKAMDIKNDQVTISEFNIEQSNKVYEQPIALLNLSQTSGDELAQLRMEFGPFGGISGSASPKAYGQLQIEKGGCDVRGDATPTMKGNSAALNLIDVWFNIFSVDFDLEKKNVKDMDVRYTTGIFGIGTGIIANCKSDPEINAQFSDNVNVQLESYKDEVSDSPGLSLLNEILSNNKEGKVSGLD